MRYLMWHPHTISGLVLFLLSGLTTAHAQIPSAQPASIMETRVWEAAAAANEPGPVEQYLLRYPKGRFTKPARERLAAIVIRQAGTSCDSGNPRDGVGLLDRYIALLPDQARIYGSRGLCRFKIGQTEAGLKDLAQAIKISPTDATLYFTRGTINLNSGKLSAALEDLGEAVRLRPDYEPAWGNLCFAELSVGHDQAAVDDCSHALRLTPADQISALNRAFAYLSLQKYDLSFKDADTIANQPTANGDALALRGVLRFKMGQKEAAARDLDASVEKPVRLVSLLLRADVLAQLGRTNDALRDLDSACQIQPNLVRARTERSRLRLANGDLRGALDDLDVAVKQDSRNPELRYQRSYVRGLLGDIAGRLSDLDEGIRIDETSSSKGLRLRGDVLRGLGRYQDALADLNEAVRRSPMDAESLALRGFVLSAIGRTSEGEADFAKALSVDPKSPSIYRLKGDILKAANSSERALSAYTQAINLAPTDPEARIQRGALLMQVGRYEAAIQDFDNLERDTLWRPIGESLTAMILFATGHRPTALLMIEATTKHNPIGLMGFFAYYSRGAMNKGIDRCDLAVDDFSRAIEYAPDGSSILDFPILKERIGCYITLKKIDLALKDVKRLLEKDPKNAAVILLKGDADWTQNNLDAALTDYSQATEIDSSNYDAQYGRASVLGKLARPGEAMDLADKLVQLNPSDPRGFLLRAALYSDLGQNGKALADRIRAFQLDDSADTLRLIAQTYRSQGQIPDSMEQLAHDFKLSPTSSAPRILHARMLLAINENAAAIRDLDEVIRRIPRSAKAYSLRADANNALGDETAYERDLRRVIELDPKDHSRLNALAYLLSSRPDRLSEARGLIVRAMQYAPEDPDYLDTRGWIEYGLGNFADAELYQRQAAMGDSASDPVIHDHLATILLHNGDGTGAKRQWESALKNLEAQTPVDSKRVGEIRRALDRALATPSSPKAPRDLAVVRAQCDVDCIVAVDSRDIRRLRAGRVEWVPAFAGTHTLSAITWDGLDRWSGDIDPTSAPDRASTIALVPVREARKEREKTLTALKTSIPSLQSALAAANQNLTVARAEAAKAAEGSPLAKRRRADQLRDKLVSYIESTEGALRWENEEAARLESAAQQEGAIGDNSTAGQLVGLFGKIASTRHQSSATMHRDRANRLLGRVDSMTTELGKLAETDDIQADHIPLPASQFKISTKEGSKWMSGEARIVGGDMRLDLSGTAVQYRCSELKTVKRQKDVEFFIEYGKTKAALKAETSSAREQLFELWYLGCPQSVSW